MVEALDAAAQRTLLGLGTADSPSFTGLTITGTAPVAIQHIHGSIAGNFYVHVRNTSGGALAAGTAVYATGSVGGTDRITVAACDPTDPLKMPAIGVLETTLANNGDGDAVVLGELRPFNTNSYQLGDQLYVGAGGAMVATIPASGEVQQVGSVVRVNVNTGTILVNTGAAMARVGFTGAYADLSGAPSIPSPADAAPQPLAATAAVGSGTDYALGNHQHQRDTDQLVVNLSGSKVDPTAENGIETYTFQWPAQILASALSADTAASGSAFQVNARLNASSIYSVRPQIAVGSTTGSSGTLAITTAAAGDVLRFDISQAGGGCRLAKLYLTVRRNDA
jgi:hypothetical protein